MYQVQENQPVLLPEYLNVFHCIRGACEDTCCVGWTVTIDKSTYKGYRLLAKQDKVFRELFEQSFVINMGGKNNSYAMIKLEEGERCPFLTKDSLCLIHKNYGESYLGRLCTTYPRILYRLNKSFLSVGSFSCPEMARLGLLNQEGLKLTQASMKEVCHPSCNFFYKLGWVDETWYTEILVLAIEILQERNLTIDERLLLLGLAMQNLSSDNKTQHPATCQRMRRLLYSNLIQDELNRISPQYALQLQLIRDIAGERLTLPLTSQRYLDIHRKTLMSFLLEEGNSLEGSVRAYLDTLGTFRGTLENHSYILENYLVNSVLMDNLGLDKKIFDGYVKMVVKYTLIRAFVLGVARQDKVMSEDTFISVIQPFSKVVEHNAQYIEKVLNLLKNNNMTTLPYMAILLKM